MLQRRRQDYTSSLTPGVSSLSNSSRRQSIYADCGGLIREDACGNPTRSQPVVDVIVAEAVAADVTLGVAGVADVVATVVADAAVVVDAVVVVVLWSVADAAKNAVESCDHNSKLPPGDAQIGPVSFKTVVPQTVACKTHSTNR